MSGGGFSLDPNAVAETGATFALMSEEAKAIKDSATASEVPEVSWGVLGLVTTYAVYKSYLHDFQDHLQEAIDGFQEGGELVKNAAKSYTDADQEVVQQLQRLAKELEQIGDAPTTQA